MYIYQCLFSLSAEVIIDLKPLPKQLKQNIHETPPPQKKINNRTKHHQIGQVSHLCVR